jgi:hypothetical protein
MEIGSGWESERARARDVLLTIKKRLRVGRYYARETVGGKFIRDGTPDRWEYPQHLQGREGGWHLRETMTRSLPEHGGDPSELARHGIVHAEGLEEVGVLPPCVSSGGEAMIVCAMG